MELGSRKASGKFYTASFYDIIGTSFQSAGFQEFNEAGDILINTMKFIEIFIEIVEIELLI